MASPLDEKVIDGDTFECEVDLGYRLGIREFRVRTANWSAPELREPGGPEARQKLLRLLRDVLRFHGRCHVVLTSQVRADAQTKSFERYVCFVQLPGHNGVLHDLADLMRAGDS